MMNGIRSRAEAEAHKYGNPRTGAERPFDEDYCAREVYDTWYSGQCKKRPGNGIDGLFCKDHAIWWADEVSDDELLWLVDRKRLTIREIPYHRLTKTKYVRWTKPWIPFDADKDYRPTSYESYHELEYNSYYSSFKCYFDQGEAMVALHKAILDKIDKVEEELTELNNKEKLIEIGVMIR